MEKKKKFIGYVYSNTCREMNSKYCGWTYIYTSAEPDSTNPLIEEIRKMYGKDVFDFKIEKEIECDTREELIKELDWQKSRFIKFYNGQAFNLLNDANKIEEQNNKALKKAWHYLCDADDETDDVDEEELDDEGKAIVKELYFLRMRMETYLSGKGVIV